MLDKRLSAARRVAPELYCTEHSLDDSVSCTSSLMTVLIGARRDAGISSVVGQGVLDCVAESLRLQVQAQAKMVEAHHLLQDVKTHIGLRTFAIGTGGGEKSPYEELGQLRSVSSEAA